MHDLDKTYLTQFKDKSFFVNWAISWPVLVRAVAMVDIDDGGRRAILTVDANGNARCYAGTDSGQWDLLAQASLPAEAGPLVAMRRRISDRSTPFCTITRSK